MSLYGSLKTGIKQGLREYLNNGETKALASEPAQQQTGLPPKKGKHLPYTLKSVYRVRQDIAKWNRALERAQSDDPRNYPLQLLYNEIMLDALLTSQVENRKQQIFSSDFVLKNAAGEVDEEQTMILKNSAAFRKLTNAVLDKIYYGYSLVELDLKKQAGSIVLDVAVVPRTNIVPQRGLFYPDYSDELKTVLYRELPEFGTWILEFDNCDLGLLNKAVSHVLFKRFAQSCWSELCEIYGIPPRVMKTNTQDATMLNRAEKMLKDMGSAAYFVIDETEEFEFATGVVTNGDVYGNLIKLCSNEISLLILGAVMGQDTKHGNESKEKSSQELLWLLVQSDMQQTEEAWNSTILPALVKIGFLKSGLRFEYDPAEDITQLWKITNDALKYFNVDPEWVKDKFGIEVTAERATPQKDDNEPEDTGKKGKKLSFGNFFG